MNTSDPGSRAVRSKKTGRSLFGGRGKYKLLYLLLTGLLVLATAAEGEALNFPAAAWHRGDVSVAQENSEKAVSAALRSSVPNLEVDVLDFRDRNGRRVGLLAHDYKTERLTSTKGKFSDFDELAEIPHNSANDCLSAEPFMTVIDLFELIKEVKADGVTPYVSLDMKEEGKNGREFGRWIGELIKDYGFQDHVFASSFHKSNVIGVDDSCPECYTGGLVFNDHYALKNLDYRYTSLDLTGLSKFTYFLGFWGKKMYPHDFVLIQDDILFSNPEIVDYWKNVRNVRFVGMFVYDKERPYTEREWDVINRVDWVELDPLQMRQKLEILNQ